MIETTFQNKQEILSLIRQNRSQIIALGVKKLGLFGSFVRNEQKEVMQPTDPKIF